MLRQRSRTNDAKPPLEEAHLRELRAKSDRMIYILLFAPAFFAYMILTGAWTELKKPDLTDVERKRMKTAIWASIITLILTAAGVVWFLNS